MVSRDGLSRNPQAQPAKGAPPVKRAFRNKNTHELVSSREEGAGGALEGGQAARSEGDLPGPGSCHAQGPPGHWAGGCDQVSPQEGPCVPSPAVPTLQVGMGTEGEGGCWGPCAHAWDRTPSDSPWRVPGAEHRRGGDGSHGRKTPTCLAPISGRRPGAATVEAERPKWLTGWGCGAVPRTVLRFLGSLSPAAGELGGR